MLVAWLFLNASSDSSLTFRVAIGGLGTTVGSACTSGRFAYTPMAFSRGQLQNNSAMLIVLNLEEETVSDD